MNVSNILYLATTSVALQCIWMKDRPLRLKELPLESEDRIVSRHSTRWATKRNSGSVQASKEHSVLYNSKQNKFVLS